jgi:hypothetical protein
MKYLSLTNNIYAMKEKPMGIKDSSITELLKKIKGIDVDLPDLEPNEPAATHEQIEEIGKLTEHFLPDDKIISLGKWQAAHLILKLKEAEIFSYLEADSKVNKSKHRLLNFVILAAVFVFIALLVLSFLIKKN